MPDGGERGSGKGEAYTLRVPALPAATWTVFLDRDGVLNRKAAPDHYIRSWKEFVWLPGAREAVSLLRSKPVYLFVVTNQQGVARGAMTRRDVDDIHRRIRDDVALDGIYVCPHLAGTCDCRKPETGLFEQARRDFPDVRFDRSIVVGDSPTDIEAGRRIGARTVFIRRDSAAPPSGATAEARDLPDAVELILRWI